MAINEPILTVIRVFIVMDNTIFRLRMQLMSLKFCTSLMEVAFEIIECHELFANKPVATKSTSKKDVSLGACNKCGV